VRKPAVQRDPDRPRSEHGVLGPASLWRKELRDRLPFLALVLALYFVADFMWVLLTEYPDQRTLSDALLDFEPGAGALSVIAGTVVIFLVVLSLCYGLLVGERDRGTLEFLDALPVSRTQIFIAKVGTALLVLFAGPVSGYGVLLIFHALSRTSLDPGFHGALLLSGIFLDLCQILVMLGVGLLLSFLRRFAWPVAGLLVLVWLLFRESCPALRLLDIKELSLINQIIEGRGGELPWSHLAVQLSVAMLCYLGSWCLFLGGGERLLVRLAALKESRSGRILLFFGATAALVLWGFLVGRLIMEVGSTSDEVQYAGWSPSRLSTESYVFTFRTDAADRARAMTRGADHVAETVSTYLRSPPLGIIAVDLTRSSSRGIAGHAHWKTIAMDLDKIKSREALLSTLGHETVHVYIDILSDDRMTRAFQWTRFFHEGLAEYVQYRFFEPPESLDRCRAVAAILRSRGDVDFERMMDDGELSRLHDPMIVYPLGESFVAALIERYGDDAPVRIVRAFGRKEAPKDLKGMALWQDVFQTAGFNLDEAVDAFYMLLDRGVERNRELIEGLPAPVGEVLAEDHRIGVRARWDGAPDWTVVCRFRTSVTARHQVFVHREADEQGVFWSEKTLLTAGLWYQLGLREEAGDRTIWEPWVAVEL